MLDTESCTDNFILDGGIGGCAASFGDNFSLHMADLTNADAKRFSELLETCRLVQHVNFPTVSTLLSLGPLMYYYFAACVLAITSVAATIKDISFRKWKGIDLTTVKDI